MCGENDEGAEGFFEREELDEEVEEEEDGWRPKTAGKTQGELPEEVHKDSMPERADSS